MGFLSSLFGVSDRTPKTSQIVQANKLPEEIAPYVKDVLGESQALYKADIERGYDPYTGETIAPFTPQEEQAMAGLEGLVGTQKPYLDEALETYRKGGDEFTAETAEKFMSPYQQAVTDIQLREAQENFEGKVMPQFEAQAVGAGGMSGLGSRAGIEAAELQRGQSQLLSDIQAQGSQRAYADARAGYEAQKAREQTMATNVGRIGNAMTAAGLQEQGMLQTVGEQKRGMGQSILDEAYGKFLEEKNYPQQTLGVYSDTIYGAAPTFRTMNKNETTSGLPGAPSMGQQLLGLGMAGANSFNSGTLGKIFGGGKGNVFQQKDGGPVIEAQSGTRNKTLAQLRQEAELKRYPQGKQFTSPRVPGTQSVPYGMPGAKYIHQQQNPKIAAAYGADYGPVQPPPPAPVQVAREHQSGGLGSTTVGQKFNPRPSTTSKSNKLIPSNSADMVTVEDRDLQKAQKRFQNVISVLGMGDTISGGTLKDVKIPDIETETVKLTTEISQDPRFNVDALRKRRGDAIQKTVGELRKNIERKEKIQSQGYDEEASEIDTFIDEQTTSIQEDGATTSDIMAEAIDQGMKEPTIVTMLTKVLNTNEKGVQKRAREVRKELRDLKKQEFIMEKEGRKEKRTDALANAQLKSDMALRKITMTLGLEEELMTLPAKQRDEVRRRLAQKIQLKGSVIKNVKDVYSIAAEIIKESTSGTTKTGKPQSMVGYIDLIRKDMNDGTNYILGKNAAGEDQIQLPDGTALTQAQTEEYMRKFNAKKRAFTDRVKTLDPTMSNNSVFSIAYADTQTGGGPSTSGGQAGSNQNNPMNLTGMTQANYNALPSGTWVQGPQGIAQIP